MIHVHLLESQKPFPKYVVKLSHKLCNVHSDLTVTLGYCTAFLWTRYRIWLDCMSCFYVVINVFYIANVSAWAEKRGFLTAKAARNDVYRAANHLLRMASEGRLCLCMKPPGYYARKGQ